jgi:hypothetical protein
MFIRFLYTTLILFSLWITGLSLADVIFGKMPMAVFIIFELILWMICLAACCVGEEINKA